MTTELEAVPNEPTFICGHCEECVPVNWLRSDGKTSIPNRYTVMQSKDDTITYTLPNGRVSTFTQKVEDPNNWCRNCVMNDSYYCEECEKRWCSDDWDYTFVDGDAYCNECCENRFTWCENCEEWRGSRCTECDPRSRVIHDYSYKPTPIFHNTGEDDFNFAHSSVPYMGIELEIENRGSVSTAGLSDTFHEWDENEENFYLKYDGSLSNGFEIVSHPRTLESWKELSSDFQAILDKLGEMGARSWNTKTCGLHIHVSKNSFKSEFHMAVFNMLFSRNAYDWQRVAGRESTYARFDRLQGNAVKLAKNNCDSNHFDAINLSPEHTIEIRIWKPSLRFGRVLADLEFVESARLYTAKLTSHDVMNGALNFFTYAQTLDAWSYPNARRVLDGANFTTPQEV